jgi:hypothetical protein
VSAEEIEITIDRAGKVTVHLKGVKGPRCEDYAKWLAEAVGRAERVTPTHEAYEPDAGVKIQVDQRERRG